jgi:hypothetical protein
MGTKRAVDWEEINDPVLLREEIYRLEEALDAANKRLKTAKGAAPVEVTSELIERTKLALVKQLRKQVGPD